MASDLLTRDDVPVDDRLCLALHTAARAMDAVYRPLLERFALTYPQYLVMSVLWEDGSQQLAELAERLSLDPSTLSPLLKRLEARRLLRRRRDVSDERRVVVRLTSGGTAMGREAAGLTHRVCAATGLDDVGQADLVGQLRDLTRSLRGRLDGHAAP